jgi:hypothetical protein
MTGGGVVEGYRRAVEPAVRGVAGVVVTVAFFAAAAAVGGRGGVVIASVCVAMAGIYCLANFRHCRETHCAVTGPGWAGRWPRCWASRPRWRLDLPWRGTG